MLGSQCFALIGADRGAGSRFGQSRGTGPEDAALEDGKKKKKTRKQRIYENPWQSTVKLAAGLVGAGRRSFAEVIGWGRAEVGTTDRDNSVVLGFLNSSLKWNLDTVFCHKRSDGEDQKGEMSLCKSMGEAGFTAWL